MEVTDVRRAMGGRARRRRRALRCVGGSLLVVTGLVAAMLAWPVARISPGVAAKIRPGMTLEEVERVVGGPPGRYDGVRSVSTNAPFIMGTDGRREWTGEQGTLVVMPDENGCVSDVAFYPAAAVERDAWGFCIERLTRSTKAQWGEWWLYGESG